MMPVCVKCGLFFHPKKNSIVVEEGMPVQGAGWVPYKLWFGDLVQCKGCKTEICIGFGQQPFGEHYQANYNSLKAKYTPYVFVKDCC